MTQQTLGDAVGATYQQVQKYENARSHVSAGRLYEISRELRAPLDAFFKPPAKPSARAEVETALAPPTQPLPKRDGTES